MGYIKISFVLLIYIKSYTATESPDDYEEETEDSPIGVYCCDDDILILQTLDGRIHAVEKTTGDFKWDVELNKNWFPKTNEEGSNQSDDLGFNFLPDPSDGSIYTYLNGRLSKLPLTIPQMVERSPSRSNDDDTIYIGDKKDSWFIIDKRTGQVKRKINHKGSQETADSVFAFDDIYIGYTDFSLAIFDSKSDELKWNMTYSELRATESVAAWDAQHLDIEVSASSGDIIIQGSERHRKFKRQLNLGFPVIGVFSSSPSGLRRHQFKTYPADHFSPVKSECADQMVSLVYVGLHRQSLYAISSYSDTNKKIISNECPDCNNYDIIGWHEIKQVTETRLLPAGEGTAVHCKIGDAEDKCTDAIRQIPSISDKARQVHILQRHFYIEQRKKRREDRHLVQKDMRRRRKEANLKALRSLTTGRIVDIAVHSISNVQVLQALVLLLLLALIISFSWRNIFDENMTVVGQIEFDPAQMIGKGCVGTSVYRGTFDGRDVAVKRMLADSFALAEQEIRLLRQAEHPNLLRYYCSEKDKMFIYIALELCDCDLEAFVSNREDFELTNNDILLQCANGLEQLHSLGVIHRDIKPSNILITYPKRNQPSRAVIADFGLCRQIESGRSSISVTGLHGTEGWAAPEVFSRDSRSVTYAVDIFSLGCVYYFCLSGGKHPYGSEFFMRQAKIHQGRFELENIEANEYELISRMIQPSPTDRITVYGILASPIFWPKDKILRFLSETSDKLEREDLNSKLLFYVETFREEIGGSDWKLRLATVLQEDLRKFRTYGVEIKDLLRAIRNKRHHQRDLTAEAQQVLGLGADTFWNYFDCRFPHLLSTVYKLVTISYAEDQDVNFAEFYDLKSAQIAARLITKQINHLLLSEEITKETVNKTLQITGSESSSPKQRQWNQIEDSLTFSHKIKTRMIWKDKDSPKNKIFNKTPDRLEPSKCRLLDGSYIEISKDIPLRDEQMAWEDIKYSFPTFLRVYESLQEEKVRAQQNRTAELKKFLYLSNNVDNLYNNRMLESKPKLIGSLSTFSSSHTNVFQKGIHFLQRQFSDSGLDRIGHEMCENLLKEELDHNSEEINFDRDPTPPPFHIPQLAESVNDSQPMLSASEDEEEAPVNNDQLLSKKPRNRRKRPKKKKNN